MNLDALVSRGEVAWLPHRDARNLDAYHVQDIPLIGTFEHMGAVVLFACLVGGPSATSCWAYVPLSQSTVGDLGDMDFKSTSDLEAWVHDQFVSKRVVFAMTSDGLVDEWSSDFVVQDSVLEASIRFMHAVLDQLQADTDALRRRSAQARADATLKALVHA